MVAPIAAMAQPVTGLYVGAGLGGFYQPQTNVPVTSFGTVNAGGGKYTSDGGFVGLGSVGYGIGFGPGLGFRAEIEGNYRQTSGQLSGAHTPTGGLVRGGGDIQTYGVMVNGLVDFDPGLGFLFPYLGAGVGYDREAIENGSAYAVTGPAHQLNLSPNSQGNLAVQGIAGVAIPIAAIPGLSLTAEYRYHTDVDNESFRGRVPVAGGTLAGRVRVDSIEDHAGLIGLRYALNAAPPPPPAQPPVVMPPTPGVTRTYLVFFDWDRSDLTGRARQIIADAAKNSTAVAATRIEVNGNADRSGTPQYNMGLSLRRAQTVAAELVRDGVPRAEIDIHAYGDTRPLVPTAPGVREPQNRRVEIILH
jgi:outer membrane protein OmpA-like peptidoglycan-associated protein